MEQAVRKSDITLRISQLSRVINAHENPGDVVAHCNNVAQNVEFAIILAPMNEYRDETQGILKRFSEDLISRAECVNALDCALLAAIPELNPPEFPAVQAILAENSRRFAELDGMKRRSRIALLDQPEPVAVYS